MDMFNKKVVFPLSLAVISFGVFSCGGGGDSEVNGSCLPTGHVLNLTATMDSPDANSFDLTFKLVGNGSDLPEFTINNATNVDDSASVEAHTIYRRTGKKATLTTSYKVNSGQFVAPGPVVTVNLDECMIKGTINYNTGDTNVSTSGSFTGVIDYKGAILDDAGNEQVVAWTANDGTVTYRVNTL